MEYEPGAGVLHRWTGTAPSEVVLTGLTLPNGIGWNAEEKFEAKDLPGQFEQLLRNLIAVLAEAEAGPEHVVRMTWYITDKQAYLRDAKRIGEIYRAIMGRVFPVMAVVQVVALMENEAKIEIEVTAVVPD